MITELRVRNFKCFPALDVGLGQLTILSGGNGAGKSSVLEALLLAAELRAGQEDEVALSGSRLDLRSWNATWCADGGDPEIDIALDFSNDTLARWRLAEMPLNDPRPGVARVVHRDVDVEAPPLYCRFIHAERIGPRPAFDLGVTGAALGPRGENLAGFLAEQGRRPIANPNLHHPAAVSDSLLHETEAWLGRFAPDIRIELQPHGDLGVAALGFSFPGPAGRVGPFPATHNGFGLTYVLPILLAVLSAGEHDLVLLQNPEAHLHPRAQRRLTELFVRAAAQGVQLVVETHSDHVINGARIGVKQCLITPEKVRFQHFLQDDDGARCIVEPRVQADGSLSQWPDGFFDEWDDALRDLVGPT